MVLKVQFAFHAWCNLLPGGWACIPVAVPSSSLLALAARKGELGHLCPSRAVQGDLVDIAAFYPLLAGLFGAGRRSSSPAFLAFTLSTPPCTTAYPWGKAQLTRTE